MGLSQAMSTAISGLVSHQLAMDTIGNNLANVNTTGYKRSDYTFSTLLSATLQAGTESDGTTGRGSINPIQVGLGAQTGSITTNFEQGGFETTYNSLDFCLDGVGFFVLKEGNSYAYSRDGSFYLGDDYALLGSDGLHVEGVMADNKGNIKDTGQIEDVYIKIGSVDSAHETSEISMTGNLDSREGVVDSTKLIAGTVGTDVSTYLGADITTVGTSSWNALATATSGTEYINGGAVQTSAAYAEYDSLTGLYYAANINTNLSDVYYRSGNTWVKAFGTITDGDTIDISFDKGGVSNTASFEYDYDTVSGTGNSYTLGDFMKFLTGGVDRTAEVDDITEVQSLGNTDIVGGVMGTVCLAGRVSSSITGGEATYSSPIETAGAFTRTLATSVDYGTGVLQDSFNLSIVSNLGDANKLSDIQITFKSVAYDDMFAADADLGAIEGASSTTTSLAVYDSLGNQRDIQMTLSLVQQDTNFSTYRWESTSTDDTDDVYLIDSSTGQILTNAFTGTGTITFDSQGNYVKGSQYSETGGITVTLDNMGVNTPLVVSQTNFSRDTQDLDFSSLSFTALDTSLTLASQNGNAPGTLETFSVTADGVIQGSYSNGVVKDIARLVVALIPNEMGLVAGGDNLFYVSPSSGDAQIEFAGVGGRASVYNEKLEISNVDMSTEFTDLISIQRGFQSNTRVITASDEMLQELLNMKG